MNTERRNQPAANDQPGRPRSADVILIPKQLRAEWMDAMAVDPKLSPTAFKVAGVIGSHFNRHRGDTYVSQETLADILQLGVRTVQKAVGELEARGYLIVERRELGHRRDGRLVCGGRGIANTYSPAIDGGRVAATSSGRRFADRIDDAWERTHRRAANPKARGGKVAPECVLPEPEGGTGVRPLENERTQFAAGKVAPECVPTLGDPTDHNPGRGRAAARKDAAAHPLGAALRELERALGPDLVQTWFGRVTLEAEEAGRLVLGTPSGFERDWLAGRHEQDVRNAWNRSRPQGSALVDRVDFVVVKP